MNDSKTITSGVPLIKAVNTCICLDENNPLKTVCNLYGSSYQSLVDNGVCKCADMLSLCSLDTVFDDKNYFSIEIAIVNPKGLATKQYLQHLINNSREQNSNIKVLATLNDNQVSLSKIFSLD